MAKRKALTKPLPALSDEQIADIKEELDPLMVLVSNEQVVLKKRIAALEKKKARLKALVNKMGGVYEVYGIRAVISHPMTWNFNVRKLLATFGKIVYPLLNVKVKEFKEMLNLGQLGEEEDLKKKRIAWQKPASKARLTVTPPSKQVRKKK